MVAMEELRVALQEERQMLHSMAQENMASWRSTLEATFDRLEEELGRKGEAKRPFDLDHQQKVVACLKEDVDPFPPEVDERHGGTTAGVSAFSDFTDISESQTPEENGVILLTYSNEMSEESSPRQHNAEAAATSTPLQRAGPSNPSFEAGKSPGLSVSPHARNVLGELRNLDHGRAGSTKSQFKSSEAVERIGHETYEELLQLVLEHLARRFPERFELSDDRFASLQEGLEWQLKDVEPLDLLASLLQEDVCIMHERSTPQGGTEHLFVAGVVMESFDPVAKHMQPMMKLHEPVPGYAADLHDSMGRVFSTLRKPVWRANFAMAEYRGGDEAEAAEMDMRPEAIVSRLYLKVEYETLRRLPQNSQYLVFTIRPYMDPLPAWSRTPLACRALASEIRRLPEGVLDYKGLGEPQVCSATLAFFDAVCAASGVDVQEAMPAS